MKKIIYVALSILSVMALGRPLSAEAAPKTKTKKITDPNVVLQQGREAFFNYNYEEAEELYDQYLSLKKKAKQEPSEEYKKFSTQLEIATNAFDRVQKIIVVDSLSFPKSDFFESYKLAQSAGKLVKTNDVTPLNVEFVSETGDYVLKSILEGDGEAEIVEKRRLLDGTWQTNVLLDGNEMTGNCLYPFMRGDGQTLYFSNDGDESMGGLDLFVVQVSPITGEILQPLNLGMPFNSPFNDYMMAIDEESGLGWWATDRNDPEGETVTVYVYKLDEVRKNYPTDTEDLVKYARLNDFKATQKKVEE